MNEQRCWKLVYPDGRDFEGDHGDLHFESRTRALEVAPETALQPAELDHVCVNVECANCEDVFDEDGDGYVFHFPSREEGLRFVREFGWTVAGDSAWCPAEECVAAADTEPSTPPVTAPPATPTPEPTDTEQP